MIIDNGYRQLRKVTIVAPKPQPPQKKVQARVRVPPCDLEFGWRSGQKMPEAKRKRIEELARLGLTGSEIANRVQCGVSTALRIMRSIGLESPYITARKKRHAEILAEHDPNLPITTEAERLGYHRSTVRRALSECANG